MKSVTRVAQDLGEHPSLDSHARVLRLQAFDNGQGVLDFPRTRGQRSVCVGALTA